MSTIINQLHDISATCVWGINLGVIGIVSIADFEAWLKVAVLAATLVLTCLSVWLKWKNRNKTQD